MTAINYNSEPTLAKFHNDDSFVRGIMGPIGSGKSAGCCVEILSRARKQNPDDSGVRRSRWVVIRNTYPELKTTTIKTWQDWIPDAICPIKMDAPISGRMKQPLSDETHIDMEVFFLALDRPADVKKLLSLELTGGWINEARELPKSVLDMLTGRVGRYPAKIKGGPTWSGVFMDTNPPDDDHWWYRVAEEEMIEEWKFFKQPPALIKKDDKYIPNPKAENVVNQPLGYAYWLRQIPGKSEDWIGVYILGEYGTTQDGKPVYPEYRDSIHASDKELKPYPNIPLLLGMDFGLTPACVICQLSPRGQFMAIDEIVAEDMGIQQFITDAVKPFLNINYHGFELIIVGDPAGAQRAQTDEQTCFEYLAKAGLPAIPASSNKFKTRREAVAEYLTKLIDGEPGFIISPKCKKLRKGFKGGYKYKRIAVSGEERYNDAPDKNQYSHINEATQYIALYSTESNIKANKAITKAVEESAGAGGKENNPSGGEGIDGWMG